MRISIRLALLIFLGLELSSCSSDSSSYQDVNIASSKEASCGFIQNSKGYRVSWKAFRPIKFYFSIGFPEQSKAAIITAAEDWNKYYNSKLLEVNTNDALVSASIATTINTITWITDSTTFKPLEQAKTIARWRSNQMSDTDIFINAHDWTFNPFQADKIPAPNEKMNLDLESLMVHEFGHSLGLIHQDVFESVMYPSLENNFYRNVIPQKPDLADLDCEYK